MDPAMMAICMGMAAAGCLMGLFSGIVPGIHVNTLAAIMLAFNASIQALLPLEPEQAAMAAGCCIMAASVVHSFVDFVPSVFIGAPDSEDAVSVLPGHRLLLEGRGMEAVRAAAIGSLVGCSASILMAVPLQLVLLNGAAETLDSLTPFVLVIACLVLLNGERARGRLLQGAFVFLLSGILGLGCMILPVPVEGVMEGGSVMMPLLTGLFGIPVMLETSSKAKIPVQKDRVKDPVGPMPGLRGVLMGTLAGWFPGITSTVGASMSAVVFPERRPERFISTVASIGTVTSILSLVTLSVSGNGRSGTALVIKEMIGDAMIGPASEPFLMLLLASAVASLAGYWLTIASGKVFARVAGGIRPRRLGRTVLVLLVVLTLVLTGPAGLFILLCATFVGLVPSALGTGRLVLCGCLLLPVLLFKFGLFRSLFQLGEGLGHELLVVHDEPLVGAGPDLALGVPDDDLEDEPPAVDLHELGLAGDVHPDGGGGGMRHIEMRPDGAASLLEMGRHALAGGPLDQRDHRRGGEHGEQAAAHGGCGVPLGDRYRLSALDSGAEHATANDGIHINVARTPSEGVTYTYSHAL